MSCLKPSRHLFCSGTLPQWFTDTESPPRDEFQGEIATAPLPVVAKHVELFVAAAVRRSQADQRVPRKRPVVEIEPINHTKGLSRHRTSSPAISTAANLTRHASVPRLICYVADNAPRKLRRRHRRLHARGWPWATSLIPAVALLGPRSGERVCFYIP